MAKQIPKDQEVKFEGKFLERGFWLYVWEVLSPKGQKLYYVGRTGDSSSTNAQSPFNRMGQHLGFLENSNMLRRYLRDKYHIRPELCRFRLVAYGPILPEAKTAELHRSRRDIIAALEKALCDAMVDSRHEVMNRVRCRKLLDKRGRLLFAGVRTTFGKYFPRLRQSARRTGSRY